MYKETINETIKPKILELVALDSEESFEEIETILYAMEKLDVIQLILAFNENVNRASLFKKSKPVLIAKATIFAIYESEKLLACEA